MTTKWLRMLVVLTWCGIADSAQAAPILEPDFKKVNPNPDGDLKLDGLKQGGLKQGDVINFKVTDPSEFSNVLNDTGFTIFDLHLKIVSSQPAGATWGDVDGDGKIGTPATGIFTTSTLSPDGTNLALFGGGTIPPGGSFSPLFKIKDLGEDGFVSIDGFYTTPEPATLLLLGTTMAGLGLGARWRQRRRK